MNIDRINQITNDIIGCAMKYIKHWDRDYLSLAYKECLRYLLTLKGYKVESEVPVPIVFKEVKPAYRQAG